MILVGILLCTLALGARLLLGYPRPARRFTCLARHEVAIAAAAADAAFPAGGAIEPSGTAAGVPRYLDRYLAGLSRRVRILVRLLFLLVEHATLLFPAPGWDGWRRFSSLAPDQRLAVLQAWEQSRLRSRRLVATSLRALLTMAYLGSPTVLRQVGLAPLAIEPVICDADLLYPRVGAPRSSIPYAPGDRTAASAGRPLDPNGPLHPFYAEDGA